MKPERFTSGGELRADGRTLAGPAIVYGEISPTHRERFLPGAFDLRDGLTRWLDIQHDRSRVLAHTENGGLELRDTPKALELRAVLPAIPVADRALEMVRDGLLTGFSVDFRALDETRDDAGVRVIKRARLNGIGLVRKPSYSGSQAELRARSGIVLRTHIPSNTPMDCECSGAECQLAEFTNEALDSLLSSAAAGVQGALDDLADETRNRDIVAAFGSYRNPLGSLSRETLRLTKDGDRLSIEIDLPDSDAGRAVMAAHEDAGVVVRPFLDDRQSVGKAVQVGNGQNKMVYSKAIVRAFIVSATDRRDGWPEPTLTGSADAVRNDDDLIRRAAIWL